MNKLILVILGSLIIALPACKQKQTRAPAPCTEFRNQQLEDEVKDQFYNLLAMAEKENFTGFENFITDSASAMTEGYWIPSDSVDSYIYKVFVNLANDIAVKIDKLAYDVVCCHSTALNHRILAHYKPIDTTHGCPSPMMVPMNLRITPEPASNFNDYDKGVETMQIRPVDTSGDKERIKTHSEATENNTKLFRPVERKIPIKTMAVSIVWDKDHGIWKVKHMHVSLGLKRTSVYKLELVE